MPLAGNARYSENGAGRAGQWRPRPGRIYHFNLHHYFGDERR